MKRNVLVTGGAGYVGSHTCKALAKAGFTPVAYDDLSKGHADSVRWGPLIVGDLGDRTKIQETLLEYEISGVLHFAADAYVGESISNPARYFQNNVVNTHALLDVVLDEGVGAFVFSSSCATYGIPRELPISETQPQEPINPYGSSKLMVEQILRWYGEAYGLSHASLRYFNAAGADPDGEIGECHDPETHLIPLVIAAARGAIGSVQIFGTDYPTADGTAVRDYVHVSDLADAHVRALELLLERKASLQLNLGTGRGHSIREVVKAVEQVAGRTVPVLEAGRRAGDPPALIAASERARDVLGWEARYSDLSTIVKTAWRWHARMSAGTAVS